MQQRGAAHRRSLLEIGLIEENGNLCSHSVLTVVNFSSGLEIAVLIKLQWSIYLSVFKKLLYTYNIILWWEQTKMSKGFDHQNHFGFYHCHSIRSVFHLNHFHHCFFFFVYTSRFPWSLVHVLAILTTLTHEGSVVLLLERYCSGVISTHVVYQHLDLSSDFFLPDISP